MEEMKKQVVNVKIYNIDFLDYRGKWTTPF